MSWLESPPPPAFGPRSARPTGFTLHCYFQCTNSMQLVFRLRGATSWPLWVVSCDRDRWPALSSACCAKIPVVCLLCDHTYGLPVVRPSVICLFCVGPILHWYFQYINSMQLVFRLRGATSWPLWVVSCDRYRWPALSSACCAIIPVMMFIWSRGKCTYIAC
jgi:hypothetical protein